MPIQTVLSEDDLVALAVETDRFRRRASTALQIYNRTFTVLWLVFFAGLALATATTLALAPTAGVIAQTLVIAGAAFVLWLVLFGIVLRRLQPDTTRGFVQEELAIARPLALTTTIDEGGITVESEQGAIRYPWHDVRTVVEAEGRLFFFLTFSRSVVIPFGGLPEDEQRALFAQIVAQRDRFPDNDPADLGTR
ncbi:MAG: YcxB family protein [Dehalococcoidia bacterium]